jgi:hypothetical protein
MIRLKNLERSYKLPAGQFWVLRRVNHEIRRVGARQFPEDFRAGRSPTAKFASAALEAGMKQGIFRKDDIQSVRQNSRAGRSSTPRTRPFQKRQPNQLRYPAESDGLDSGSIAVWSIASPEVALSIGSAKLAHLSHIQLLNHPTWQVCRHRRNYLALGLQRNLRRGRKGKFKRPDAFGHFCDKLMEH